MPNAPRLMSLSLSPCAAAIGTMEGQIVFVEKESLRRRIVQTSRDERAVVHSIGFVSEREEEKEEGNEEKGERIGGGTKNKDEVDKKEISFERWKPNSTDDSRYENSTHFHFENLKKSSTRAETDVEPEPLQSTPSHADNNTIDHLLSAHLNERTVQSPSDSSMLSAFFSFKPLERPQPGTFSTPLQSNKGSSQCDASALLLQNTAETLGLPVVEAKEEDEDRNEQVSLKERMEMESGKEEFDEDTKVEKVPRVIVASLQLTPPQILPSEKQTTFLSQTSLTEAPTSSSHSSLASSSSSSSVAAAASSYSLISTSPIPSSGFLSSSSPSSSPTSSSSSSSTSSSSTHSLLFYDSKDGSLLASFGLRTASTHCSVCGSLIFIGDRKGNVSVVDAGVFVRKLRKWKEHEDKVKEGEKEAAEKRERKEQLRNEGNNSINSATGSDNTINEQINMIQNTPQITQALSPQEELHHLDFQTSSMLSYPERLSPESHNESHSSEKALFSDISLFSSSDFCSSF